MKTNKLIFGILGAIAVVSAADAKKMTEERCLEQEGMVWVERDSVCIPENPCSWDSYGEDFYEDYCKRLGGIEPVCIKLDEVLDKFTTNVLNLSMVDYTKVVDEGPGNSSYYGIKTSDGGYFGTICANYGESDPKEILTTAAWAYGHNPAFISSVNANGYSIGALQIVEDISESECSEIVDFANTLSSETFEYSMDDGYCKLLISNPDFNQF